MPLGTYRSATHGDVVITHDQRNRRFNAAGTHASGHLAYEIEGHAFIVHSVDTTPVNTGLGPVLMEVAVSWALAQDLSTTEARTVSRPSYHFYTAVGFTPDATEQANIAAIPAVAASGLRAATWRGDSARILIGSHSRYNGRWEFIG